jgi:hypothetical protein
MSYRGFIVALSGWVLVASQVLAAGREQIELRHVALDLAGPPARVLPADLNGDGHLDLVIVVAYTEIQQISEDRIEDMIQFTRVIPTLFDRRQATAYLASAAGGYEVVGEPLELPLSVLHMEAGPPGVGLIALTDDGLSRVVFDPTSAEGSPLRLEPLIEDPPVLARTGSFYASLDLVRDLDGDGRGDVLLPTRDGLAVYLTTPQGLATSPVQRIQPYAGRKAASDPRRRWYPTPEVGHVNGDELPDLIFFRGNAGSQDRIGVWLGTGGGRFRPLRDEPLDCHDHGSDLRKVTPHPDEYPWLTSVTAFRDIDGDRWAEAVVSVEQSRGDGWRKEMKDAKKPISNYRFHDLTDDVRIEADPYFEMQVIGHDMEGSFEDDDDADQRGSPFRLEQFVDLDADGLEDLVTITLDFSIFQVVKILATKKLGVGVHFHVFAQQADGSFHEVQDLDLSEKLKLDLNNLKIGRFGQFAGDFDGDGRKDFVHLGRGTTITVHRGQPGCNYPAKPDLSIELDHEPNSLDLVRIEDIDGDGRSDIRITRPMPLDDPDVTAPARLDL